MKSPAIARVAAALMLIMISVAGLSSPASAASSAIDSATLTWSISDYVATSPSLTGARTPIAPTTLDTANGEWTLRQGTGVYDPTTGNANITFPGGLELGNTTFGNFAVRFTDLKLTIVAGQATLQASVDVRQPGASTFDPPTYSVTIAQFATTPEPLTDGSASFTVTPETDDVTINPKFAGAQQFPTPLISALPPMFTGFFTQTDAAGPTATKNLVKLPNDLRFTIMASTTTTTTTVPSPTTVPASTTTSLPSTTPSDTETRVESGSLDWGVKDTFVRYMESPASGGSISVTAPATRTSGGPFHFPLSGTGTATGTTTFAVDFGGAVRFDAHGGVLDFTITEPRVSRSGNSGALIVDAKSKDQETGEMISYDDITMAELNFSGIDATSSGNTVTFADVPATLTEAGAPAFGGFYQAGASLDPITLHLGMADIAKQIPQATTPQIGCLKSVTVTAGQTVQLCADGFLAGEQVQAFIQSEPVLVGLTTADATGHARGTFTIPADTPAGSHRFELRGVSSGLSIFSATVTVRAAAPVSTGSATLPATGASTGQLALLGGFLLSAGAVLVAATRRRSLHANEPTK